ncbi:MAG: CDP-alcohol phosphatidyltransferase family protein, partial [Stellaceae bacterium]
AYDRLSVASILPALVILMREIMVSGLREHLAGLRVGLPVSKLAKWKTFIQMLAIGFLLVGDAGPAALHVRSIGEVLLWLAAVLTVKTGYDYLRAGLAHINRPAPQGASIKTAKPSAT